MSTTTAQTISEILSTNSVDAASALQEIIGTLGNDFLLGSIDAERFVARTGNDIVFAEGGNDEIFGDAGSDTLLGSAGMDQIFGGRNADLMSGGAGNDAMFGQNGNDAMFGDGGDDFMSGARGDDTIFGGGGDDTILGGRADDVLEGNNGDDLLDGGRGEDTITGGNGRDTLNGSRSDDILKGGNGADLFEFNPNRSNEGDDLIKDFELGVDKVGLEVNQVLSATPSLAADIVAGGGDVAAVLAALDAAADWTLSESDAGHLVVGHPTGSIEFKGIPGAGITSFSQIKPALAIDGLGEVLTSLAEASGNPASIAALVTSLSDGVADDDNTNFDLLLTALQVTGLDAVLADEEASFSVFAPTDAAFISLANRLGFGGSDEAGALTFILDTLAALDPDNDPLPLLADVLTFHVEAGAQTLGELQADGTVSPLFEGADLVFEGNTIVDQDPDFSDAVIIAEDLQTGNGTVQVINEVLLPFDV